MEGDGLLIADVHVQGGECEDNRGWERGADPTLPGKDPNLCQSATPDSPLSRGKCRTYIEFAKVNVFFT